MLFSDHFLLSCSQYWVLGILIGNYITFLLFLAITPHQPWYLIAVFFFFKFLSPGSILCMTLSSNWCSKYPQD